VAAEACRYIYITSFRRNSALATKTKNNDFTYLQKTIAPETSGAFFILTFTFYQKLLNHTSFAVINVSICSPMLGRARRGSVSPSVTIEG